MKILLIACIIALAGILGYLAEPSLRGIVTGRDSSPNSDNATLITKPAADISKYAPEQLPATVTVTEPTQFTDKSSGLTITMTIGSTAKLLRIEDGRAVVSPGETSYMVMMPIHKTDLMARLANVEPGASTNPVAPAAIPTVTQAPQVNPAPEPVAAPHATSPDPATTSAASTEPEPAAEPAAEPVPPTVTPTVAQTPSAEVAPKPMPAVSKGDVVAIMKNSILAGEIKEFNFDQVTDWKAGSIETEDGESFQTGTATYTTETLFGKKQIEAKAFIANSKVVRWVWPNSGIVLK